MGGEPSSALLVASGVTEEDGSGSRVLPISHSAGAESPLWAVVAAVGSQFLFLAPRFALRGRAPRGSCGGSFPGRSVLQCPSSQALPVLPAIHEHVIPCIQSFLLEIAKHLPRAWPRAQRGMSVRKIAVTVVKTRAYPLGALHLVGEGDHARPGKQAVTMFQSLFSPGS